MYAGAPLTSANADGALLTGSEVALQYTFGGGNLVLVLSENGFLHAYHLESGHLAWSADVGGDMIAVEVDLPPSPETIARDPLALPFLVRGNSLFTRTPFYTYNPGPSSTVDTADLLGNLPDVLRPYFFMNISTLLRRQTVFFGGTDVLVTTSVEVADLDSGNGHHITSQRRGNRHRNTPSAVLKERRSNTSSTRTAHNDLQPLLHLVRYNIVLHVMKAEEYSWSITLSQLQLSPRTTPATMAKFPGAKEHNGEGNPRFFSHLMRDMFDYDTTHADPEVKQQQQPHSTEKEGKPQTEASTAAALLRALERRRTQVAEYVSRVLSMEQYNKSHIRLHNVLEDSVTWTATLPVPPRGDQPLFTSPAADGGDAGDDVVAAAPPSALASEQAVAAYVWVSGAEQVFRIPVHHAADASGWRVEQSDHSSAAVKVRDGDARDAAHWSHLPPSSFAGAVVSTATNVLGGLPLVPFLRQQHHNITDMSLTAIAMDVEGDEREGAELDRYYHERSWWESHLLSSPNSALPSADNPIASFSTSGDVIRTGLAWRTAGIISFHVLCLAGSIAFLCAGVPPRTQLQRAWAQADRNRDRLAHSSASRPQSTQLVPQDLMGPESGGGAASPFSALLDGFSVDGPPQPALENAGTPSSFSAVDAEREGEGERHTGHVVREGQGTAFNAAGTSSKWTDPTPEEVYAMMREDSEERHSLPLTTTGSATASASMPSRSHGKGDAAAASLSRGENCERACAATANGTTRTAGTAASSSSSDDESEEIDMGERWWVRAQHCARIPSVTTLDEVASEHASSVRFSPVHDSAEEEEGKLFQLHFKVLEKVGFGGEGCVFCVEHRVTHARYAIKAILIHEQDEERVVQEAVLHSSFDNANVVRFYFCWIEDIAVSTADRLQLRNVGEDGLDTMSMGFSSRSLTTSSPTEDTLTDEDQGNSFAGDTCHMLFIQMEYFPRGTLADWLRTRQGFYRLEVLRYMQNIADGLAYLHNQDVVHRDLKPTNIFVSNANVLKIGDFGLAKRRVATGSSTGDLASNVVGGQQERSVVGGSPLYCSPEQTRGDPVNKPSDIFSLGIIAVEMLCTFATLHERIRILTDAHQGVLPEELERDFPEEVHIIKPLLACNPQQRPPLRKVQRQLLRLIDTLEESEQEAEDVPHSPAETVEPSHQSTDTGHTPSPATGMSSPKPSSDTPGAHGGVEVGRQPSLSSQKSSTASSSAALTRAVTAAGGSYTALEASSSPLSAKSPHELSALAPEDGAYEATAQHLPQWQSTTTDAGAAAGTVALAALLPAQRHHHSPRRASVSSAHSTSAGRQRNSYHNRRYTSASSSPTAEGNGGASSPDTSAQRGGDRETASEWFVTEPYGPPAMPVTYAGDANLSTILKRDMQDRTISPPD